MGLIEAVNYYNSLTEEEKQPEKIIEYEISSWGEVFTPFMGDREHSINARSILRDYPFRLFACSKPYDDPLPQILNLSFFMPDTLETINNVTSNKTTPHRITNEFVAFLSLVTRRRIFPHKLVRIRDLPIHENAHIYPKGSFQLPQKMKEIDSDDFYDLLNKLSKLGSNIGTSFILAMNLYHTAIHLFYTTPESSYLLLIIAIETISSAIYKDYVPEKNKYIDDRWGGLSNILQNLSDEQQNEIIRILITNEKFISRKFKKFFIDYLPEDFWDETNDDAKPVSLYGMIVAGENGRGKEIIKEPDQKLQPYERITKENLKSTLSKIYNARSNLVHDGKSFPSSIVISHWPMIPSEVAIEILNKKPNNNEKIQLDIPPLLTFERMVSYSLVNFLRLFSEQ